MPPLPHPISAQVTPRPCPHVPSPSGHGCKGHSLTWPSRALPIPSRGRSISSNETTKTQRGLRQGVTREAGGSLFQCLEQDPGRGARAAQPLPGLQVRLYPRAHLRPQPMELRAPPCPAPCSQTTPTSSLLLSLRSQSCLRTQHSPTSPQSHFCPVNSFSF